MATPFDHSLAAPQRNPEVIAYLKAENALYDATLSPRKHSRRSFIRKCWDASSKRTLRPYTLRVTIIPKTFEACNTSVLSPARTAFFDEQLLLD